MNKKLQLYRQLEKIIACVETGFQNIKDKCGDVTFFEYNCFWNELHLSFRYDVANNRLKVYFQGHNDRYPHCYINLFAPAGELFAGSFGLLMADLRDIHQKRGRLPQPLKELDESLTFYRDYRFLFRDFTESYIKKCYKAFNGKPYALDCPPREFSFTL